MSTRELLVGLLGPQPNLAILLNPERWPAVRDLSVSNSVATVIAGLAQDRLPPSDRIWCDQILRQSWLRHEQSLLDLEAVLSILEAAGIQPLVLKGPILARRYYTPAYLRKPSGDVDLAVRTVDLERACATLLQAGYAMPLSVRESRLRSHHVELRCAGKPRIELHFRLSHGAYGIPVDNFFDRSVLWPTPGGRQVLVLEPADQLMHLILHFAQGRFVSLFHLYEIRRIWEIAAPEIRREAVRRAARYRFSGAFALADAAFRVRWGIAMLTGDIQFRRTWLQWQWGPNFYDAYERGFRDQSANLPFTSRLRRRWLDLQLTDGPADAVRMLRTFLRAAAFQAAQKAGIR